MTKHKKHKCCSCGKIATWQNEFNDKIRAKYYCDNCVPRGFVINVDNIEDIGEPNIKKSIMWWPSNATTQDLKKNGSLTRDKDSFYYEELDECGRRAPSDDYLFDKEGFDICSYEKLYVVSYTDILDCLNTIYIIDNYKTRKTITHAVTEIFIENKFRESDTLIEYNVFMSKFGNFITSYKNIIKDEMFLIDEFYIRFKNQIKEKKQEIEK